MKQQESRFVLQCLMTIVGTAVMSFGMYAFIAPQHLAPGGISGLSIILGHVTKIPVGLLNLVLNIPMLVLGYRFLGKRFLIKTLLSVFSFTLFYDYLFKMIPTYQGETMLSALFGGILVGGGMGLAFLAESSTGGTDISSKVMQLKYPHISIGRIVFISDALVITLSAIVFQSIESAMYAVVTIFVSTRIIDALMHGVDAGTLVFVISKKSEQVGEYLTKKIGRGVTMLKATGLYTKQEQGVLVCAVRKNEYHRLKRLVHEIDESAFMIVTPATEVLGEGFKDMRKV